LNPAFIIAPLAVAAVSGVLAALIAVIDRIVNNYGEVTIDINNGKKELVVDGGAPLLIALSEQKIFVPSACGGRGSCGACKVKVTSDVGPLLPTEKPYLTKEEIADNVRLSCQIKVKENLSIEIPEYLFNIQKFEGTVEKLTDVTHDIKELLIKLVEPDSIQFSSGQYAQLVVPPYEKIKDTNQRAYSMSSKPSDKNYVELLIRLVPGGIATTYVHNYMKEGDPVQVIGPFGDFMVQDTDATMVCVAGGSGMAPFKSILYHMYEHGQTEREIWYFFGARTKKDLFYLDEMKELGDKWSNFHFIPALSEPQPEDDWKGETGLITMVLEKYLKDKVGSEKGREGYLCGSPGMLDACMQVMTKMEIPEDKIYFDKFA
jgi:Na+-transporting NADH:ubiquinone oxidoreductase subunit F